jgi:hypothetical protein
VQPLRRRISERSMSQSSRTLIIQVLILFLLSLSVRFLTWQDNRLDIGKVQTAVTDGYKDSAGQLLRGDYGRFFGDVNHLGHPPGYPIVIAILAKLFGPSDTVLQLFQILLDSLSVVLIFLIALKLINLTVALVAGVLGALSPQFAYFSVLLLPDSLIVLPILAAVYFLLRARESDRLYNYAIAGACIGLSCWLRANALFLAPFLALSIPLFVSRPQRLRAGLLIVAGAVIIIAPITIKNLIVFHRFVPVSLGAGQTLLEGIADYDKENRFDIPITDLGIMKQEAEWYGKPEYAQWLFGSEGIERDRMRVARGMSVIKSNPVWFAGVMVRRAVASTRLDPVPILAPESPFSANTEKLEETPSSWQSPVEEFLAGATTNNATRMTVDKWIRLESDTQKYGDLFISAPISVEPGHDYALVLPTRLEAGRVTLKITDKDQRKALASTIVELNEVYLSQDQPARQVRIPFVSANNSQVRFVIASNAASHSIVMFGAPSLTKLGPSSGQWLRYVRIPLRVPQMIFKTAFMIPLGVIGLIVLGYKRQFHTLALLLVVPAYYLVVQSALHTERRYVYVIHFFLTILASVALVRGVEALGKFGQRFRRDKAVSTVTN